MFQRVFVTGGTGFLGRHLVAAMCRAGYALRVLTRYPQQHVWLLQYPDVEVVRGDLTTGAGLDAVDGCDAVIHAAGLFSMWQQAGDFQAANVRGTAHLLDAAHAAGIRRLVYVSTVAVIGHPIPGRVVDEEHPAHPADSYQQSKLEAEQLVLRYHARGAFEAIVARPGAFYGPIGRYAFNRLFFTDPMRGIIMQMDGGHYVIFPAYITDVARGLILVLEKGRPGEIYNLSGESLTHRAAFDIICEEAGIRWFRLNIPGWLGLQCARLLTAIARFTKREPFWPVGLRSYVFNDWIVSSEKARRELGFQPTDFRTGARRTVQWYRDGCPEEIPELECHR